MAARFLPLRRAGEATGTTVVVDVLRAFTTAAHAFAGGADRIVMVSTIDEAMAVRITQPDWLLMGEQQGRKIDGFDLSNSPVEITKVDLSGRTLVQRTTAGTQGVVGTVNATTLYCASMVCARATADAIDEDVDFVITGQLEDHSSGGDEDLACAQLIHALASGPTDPDPYVERVSSSAAARHLLQSSELAHPRDVEFACAVDQFDFAMKVERVDGLLSVTPVRP